MHTARFNIVWLMLVIVFLLSAAALNVLVDPFDLFGTPRLAGFNVQKPNASTHTAMVKVYQIERIAPLTVLFGTSRVDIGLDPDHPAWPKALQPIYNYGFPAASILTTRQQLQHALHAGPVRLAMVGLEFHDFLHPNIAQTAEPMVEERRFLAMARAGSDIVRTQQRAIDAARAALTLTAVIDSIDTVLAQRRSNAGDVTDHGLTSESPYARLVRNDGHYHLFLQKEIGLVEVREHAVQALSGRSPAEFAEMSYLRSLIEFCRERNIELKLFIPPYHARYLEVVDATGLWERFENWKIAMVRLVEEYKGMSASPPIVLWDFASYDEYTTEAVPSKDDRQTTMKWFWEPLHYKKVLGDIMLWRMLAAGKQNFGVELSSYSINERLASGRKEREAYRKTHPGEIERIAALAQTARQRAILTSRKKQLQQSAGGG